MTKPKTISIKKFERALSERSLVVVSFYVCASKIVFVEVKTKLLRHIFLFVPHSYSFVVPPRTEAKIVNISLFDESYSSLSLPFLEKSPKFSKVDFVTVTGRMITHYGEEIIRWTFDNPETEVASESEDINDLLIDLDSSSSSDVEEINEEILDEDEEYTDLEEESADDSATSDDLSEDSSSEKKEDEPAEKSKEDKPPENALSESKSVEKPKEDKSVEKPKEDKSVEKTNDVKSKDSPEDLSRRSKDSSSSEAEEIQEEEIILKDISKETAKGTTKGTTMQPIVAKFAKKEVAKPYPTPIPSKIAETDVEIGALYPCYRLSTFLRIDRAVLEDTIFEIVEEVKDIELDSRIQRFLEIKELYSKIIKKLEDVLATAQRDEKAFFINFRKLGTLLSKSKDQALEEKIYKVAEEMNMEAIENREKVETSLYNFLTIGKLLLEE